MNIIDISPEAVERLRTSMRIGHSSTVDAERMILALSAALERSQAERDAAIMANKADGKVVVDMAGAMDKMTPEFMSTLAPLFSGPIIAMLEKEQEAVIAERDAAIAALTASKAETAAAYEAGRADALSGPWDDKPDALTDAVEAAYPHHTKDFVTYVEALELVSNRHSKGALVGLVNYLLAQNKAGYEAGRADGMREAVRSARQALVDGAYIRRGSHQETPSSVMFLAERLVTNAILAAQPERKRP